MGGTNTVWGEITRIVQFATTARVPLLTLDRSFPLAGGLMSYGPNIPANYRRAASLVDKILKGTYRATSPWSSPR